MTCKKFQPSISYPCISVLISAVQEARFPVLSTDYCKSAKVRCSKGVFTKTCWVVGGGGGGTDEKKKLEEGVRKM